METEIGESSHNTPSQAATESIVSKRLVDFAATIDRPIAENLRSVLGDYRHATVGLKSLEVKSDELQMHVHQQLVSALLGDQAAQYQEQYDKLAHGYHEALRVFAEAAAKERDERERLGNDRTLHITEVGAFLLALEEERLDQLRSEEARTGSAQYRQNLAETASAIEELLRKEGAQTSGYVAAVGVTNSAAASFGVARKAFAEFLGQRDETLTNKYPDWRTWWTLMTCSRHPSTTHLDFDTALEE